MGGTNSYRNLPDSRVVPRLVPDAVSAAEPLGFDLCAQPETGRLLGVLAAGLPTGAIIGETKTWTDPGLAWMATHPPADCRFLNYELDPDLAVIVGLHLP